MTDYELLEYELLEIDRIEKIRSINKLYDLEKNAYLSFSGGKDSTVLNYLLDLALPGNKIPRVFINTGIEYHYVVDFVKELAKQDDRIKIVNSNINIKKMLEIEGYPYGLDLQEELDIMGKYLPEEKRQCEKIWKPVYDEYRRIGYRLKNQTTIFDFLPKTKIDSLIRYIELFGGIGACTSALKKLGIDFEVADYVEIDKYAVASYNAINKTNFEPQDITKWDKDIEVDLIMSGSPCQDFSLAGLGKGGDKGSGTRSSLMYENIRIIEKLKPKYVIWENVKNLLSKKHIHNFNAYLEAMEELGYYSYYQVLNAKDYGIPQNRERVFTVSIRKDINKLFTFPPKQELKLKLKDLLEDEVDEKYYLSGEQIARIVDIEGLVSTVMENHGTVTAILEGDTNRTICLNSKSGRNGIDGLQPSRKDRIYSSDGIACTIATNDFYNPNYLVSLILPYKIRKLTPKECWRLMGFNDEDFEKAAKVNSKTQLYKQAGNSIVVNVLMAIFNNLV